MTDNKNGASKQPVHIQQRGFLRELEEYSAEMRRRELAGLTAMPIVPCLLAGGCHNYCPQETPGE